MLVKELQDEPITERTVRFSLEVRNPDGRQDRRDVDVMLREADASVSRFCPTRGKHRPAAMPGCASERPLPLRSGQSRPFRRFMARPGNHVTAFDAVKFVKVENGVETEDVTVLDNLDPECTLFGDWEPVAKEGEVSRNGEPPKKKYEQDLHVVGTPP